MTYQFRWLTAYLLLRLVLLIVPTNAGKADLERTIDGFIRRRIETDPAMKRWVEARNVG